MNEEAEIQVKHMYAQSFALSEKFTNEFKDSGIYLKNG